jgi:hypothetical protein
MKRGLRGVPGLVKDRSGARDEEVRYYGGTALKLGRQEK